MLAVMEYDTPYTNTALIEKLSLKSKEGFLRNYLYPAIESNQQQKPKACESITIRLPEKHRTVAKILLCPMSFAILMFQVRCVVVSQVPQRAPNSRPRNFNSEVYCSSEKTLPTRLIRWVGN